MVCSACSTDVPEEDLFCENCGLQIPQTESSGDACLCGAPTAEADEDGFCQQCGRRVRRPASDHMEEAVSAAFAAVSDRGLRHDHNEDRFAVVQAEAGFALVICDGVSATQHPEIASESVTGTIARELAEALRQGLAVDPEAAITSAIGAAAQTLKEVTGRGSEGENAPSTTVVTALVKGNEITVGWVGDSRAYWVDADGAKLLTRDHSWMHMVLDSGEMTLEEAEGAPQAHAITRWIGADAEGAATPEVVKHRVASSGTLLLCTDGLWNYAPEPDAVAELLRERSGNGAEALHVARELVAFALEKGGRDNITVAMLRIAQNDLSPADESDGSELDSVNELTADEERS